MPRPGSFYRIFTVLQGESFLSIWDIIPEPWLAFVRRTRALFGREALEQAARPPEAEMPTCICDRWKILIKEARAIIFPL